MNLFFWRRSKQQGVSVQDLARKLVFVATDPDKCWELASTFRRTAIPSNVLTCETSFLLGSLSIGILQEVLPSASSSDALAAGEQAYVQIFTDADEEGIDAQMAAIYGAQKLSQVAVLARKQYADAGDMVQTAAPTFVHRIKGDPRMAMEIAPLVEERRAVLRKAFTDLMARK